MFRYQYLHINLIYLGFKSLQKRDGAIPTPMYVRRFYRSHLERNKTSWQKEGLGLEGFLLLGFSLVRACVFIIL